MATALQVAYTSDIIADFARRKATLVQAVNTESLDQGGQLVFLVAGDGGFETVTRGANGLIPPVDDTQTQVTVTLYEDIAIQKKTRFNIFTSQAADQQSRLIRMNNMARVHRKQDARIIAALETGTQTLSGGAVAAMDFETASRLVAQLGEDDVGTDDDGMSLYCALTPAAYARLLGISSFASADYVNFGGDSPTTEGLPMNGRWKHWMGINWCQHGGLTGKGSASATCLAWHKNAIGYTTGTGGIDAVLGYDDENDYTYGRATIFHGAVKLQNTGIWKFTHVDTNLPA